MCHQIKIQLKQLFVHVEGRAKMQISNRKQVFDSLVTANEKLEIQLAWFKQIDLFSNKDI